MAVGTATAVVLAYALTAGPVTAERGTGRRGPLIDRKLPRRM
ncbi:hypothetical protein [Streptomyces virginiae]